MKPRKKSEKLNFDSQKRRGSVAIEYAIILALIPIGLITSLQQLGARMQASFDRVGLELINESGGGGGKELINSVGQAPEMSTPASDKGSKGSIKSYP